MWMSLVVIVVVLIVTILFVVTFVIILPRIMVRRMFNNFIKFSAIQPYSTAFRAIIDLNPILLAHQQGLATVRTFHIITICLVLNSETKSAYFWYPVTIKIQHQKHLVS